MPRWRITICKKCGLVSDEAINIVKEVPLGTCYRCGGEQAIIDMSLGEAKIKFADKLYMEHDVKYGETPDDRFFYWRDEVIREEFYYGKLDQDADPVLSEKRRDSEWDTPPKEIIIEPKKESNTPKCPVCGSTNLQKISNIGKVMSVGTLGLLGSGNLGKTYKCKNCGVKF